MSAEATPRMSERSELATAEHRLKELGITLPAPPEPFDPLPISSPGMLWCTGLIGKNHKSVASSTEPAKLTARNRLKDTGRTRLTPSASVDSAGRSRSTGAQNA